MPRARTVVKNITSLTPAERRSCLRLNMGDNGSMRTTFLQYEGYAFNPYNKTVDYRSQVVLHYDEQYKVDGWALIFQSRWHPQRSDIYFYVKADQRRKGIGTKLYNRAKKVQNELAVHPWDYRSEAFFRKFNARA